MPDPLVVLGSLLVALLVSTLSWSVGRWGFYSVEGGSAGGRWRWSLAIGLGFYLGATVLGVRPRWSLREDQDRFLGLIVPGILAAEALAPALRSGTRSGIILRLIVSMLIAPVVLHGSIYVADLAGPGTAEWPPPRRWLIFAALGLAIAGEWSCLVRVASRSRSAVRAPLATSSAVAGAGLVVMLSGYASAGLLALPLAAALVGASVAIRARRDGSPGTGLVGLCGVLMMGGFFGRLRSADALALFLAPLLAAVPELSPFARLSPRARTILGIVLTASASILVAASAWRRFQADAAGL